MTKNLAQTIKLQQLASNPLNSSWVFASAGSGKTKVLTDRVLRLLLAGNSPQKILCLTFTKVAATEMQNRINEELAKWVLYDDATLTEKLSSLSGTNPTQLEIKKARTLFAETLDSEYKIKIQTIHAFCQGLVKIFPFEAGIKPNFEIMDDISEKLLLEKARRQVFKKCSSNLELRNLVSQINSILHDETFNELIGEILAKKNQLLNLKDELFGVEGIIDEIFRKFGCNKNEDEKQIFDDFLQNFDCLKVQKIVDQLLASDSSKNVESGEKIAKFLADHSLKNFTFYQSAFLTDENSPRKFYKKIAQDGHFIDFVSEEIIKIEHLTEHLNSFKICHFTALLLKFVDAILENYASLKKQNSLLDYNDLIIETNRLLANPNFADWVKMKMDGLFDHILIDESQDTNHQQWDIIKALTEDFFSGLSSSNNNRTIFVVGDEKQSIYSFQGADPEISGDIFSYFAAKLQNHPVQFNKIDLSNSFRSLPVVLQAVDATFCGQREKSAITKISDFQGHQAIRQGCGHVAIWPQIRDFKENTKKPAEKSYEWQLSFEAKENYSAQEFLAEKIALKIKQLVAHQHALPTRQQPLRFGDFMILLRKKSDGFDKILARYFHKYQIPFSSSGRIKFSENILIQDLLAACKFALHSHDDLNLAALLKSPILNLCEDDLIKICSYKNQNECSLFQAICKMSEFYELQQKLEFLQHSSKQNDVFYFFESLLSENCRTNFVKRFGVSAVAIIDKFRLATLEFSENFSKNLQKFLEFVEKTDPEIALSGEKSNQVTITTIHSAKGLQSPILILPDCCFDTNRLRSTKEKVSWIDGLPFWCVSKDFENKALKIAREIKKEQAKEENLRLLYVAMTRAEDALYIAGSGNSNDEESWYNLIRKSLTPLCTKTPFLDQNDNDLAKQTFDITDEILQMGDANYPQQLSLVEDSAKISPQIDNFYFPTNFTKNPNNAEKNQEKRFSAFQIKGRLIHKILEIFGKNHTQNKIWLENLALSLIAKEDLSEHEKIEIRQEITQFLNSPQFTVLYDGKVNCEFEIADDQSVKIIDLLVEKSDEILVIDYKSDEIIPQKVPTSYANQLAEYKNLVGKIYPKKAVKTAIFWTKILQLQEI